MFPMISSIDEFLEAKTEVKSCISELKKEGTPGHPDPAIGMMVELPSVVELAEDFAEVADFFSIGTNDFVQYMLAVDRTNEKVADLYLPYHPSVLRALKRVVSAAISRGKDVSICGQMAQDERYIKYLLGIGIRKFSLDAASLPKIQKIIDSITITDSVADTEKLVSMKLIGGLRKIFKE
jgi:phosphotransferase system enzyme I (PtsP)